MRKSFRAHSSAWLASAALCLGWVSPALAAPRDVWVLPVQLEAVSEKAPVDLEPLSRRLGSVLREAVQDYGLNLLAGAPQPALLEEAELPELARDAWVVVPHLGLHGDELSLRLVVVPPGSKVLLVRAQHFAAAEAEVRSLGLLRELLEASLALPEETRAEAPSAAVPNLPEPARSEGRVVLALHAAALGGYLGFSLQRASGSDDARLTYPIAALGAGVGLGAAVVAADEWDIDVARAWYLSAGMVWPGLATLLLIDADRSMDPGSRNLYGILGAVSGLSLATAGVAFGDVTEGGAALTHSGAALGLLLGALGEMAIEGDTETKPRRGMGWGALTGVVVSGALASQVDVPRATDVLFIDLSALLGGLAGAALGTPILVTEDPGPTRDRLWLSGIMLGTLAGAGVGYWLVPGAPLPTGPAAAAAPAERGLQLHPQLGWQGTPLGFGLTGQW